MNKYRERVVKEAKRRRQAMLKQLEKKTLREIGAEYGISAERVRQLTDMARAENAVTQQPACNS